jgi:hypothetical protein
MPPKVTISLLASAALLAAVPALSQTSSDPGLMSGSGLVLTPTNLVMPTGEFRIQAGRIGTPAEGGRGLNFATLGVGLSPFIEGYLRFTSEQAGYGQSVSAIGFGGKMLMPFQVPLLNIASIWMETSTTEVDQDARLYPTRMTRGALCATPVSTATLRPAILIGAAREQGEPANFLAGGNLVYAASHRAELGAEYVYGYAGRGSGQVMVSGVLRVLPYLSVHASPGYVSSPGVASWVWSLGVTLNSADIDFIPQAAQEAHDEFRLPSIEELEKPAVPDTAATPGKKPGEENQK